MTLWKVVEYLANVSISYLVDTTSIETSSLALQDRWHHNLIGYLTQLLKLRGFFFHYVLGALKVGSLVRTQSW